MYMYSYMSTIRDYTQHDISHRVGMNLDYFISVTRGYGWYFFGKVTMELEITESIPNNNICKNTKESIESYMSAVKTPVRINSIMEFYDKSIDYEICSFEVIRI